ncbi:MAG: efflux RND transporter permease subunit [Candidatus Sumerlaeia bacterium]|nr:efflux RND transporter permease subunit [Candidatus Sumerlaeia bacterium]
MISRLIAWCMRNQLATLFASALLLSLGFHAMRTITVDAMPDIGEMQVIVFADWPGRSPQDVEDQVTYPLTTSLMGIPRVKAVRSASEFGFGMVNVIFEDHTDFYWARTRVLERLSQAQGLMPDGVTPILGPDATALGQIYWYTIENGWYCEDHPHGLWVSVPTDASAEAQFFEDRRDAPPGTVLERAPFTQDGRCPIDGMPLHRSNLDLAQLRSLQDWYIRFQLNGVPGVSEVATVGGYVQQYQIDVDPDALASYGVSLTELTDAVRASNIDVGAQVIEQGQVEYVVRGRGFIESLDDIRSIVVKTSPEGTPVRIEQLGSVSLGPDFRRGILDNAGVPATGGVAVMRFGENPLRVIDRLEEKITDLEGGLPPGVRIVPFYDRTHVIERAQATLTEALREELIITVIVIMLMMGDPRMAVVVCSALPMAALLGFFLMERFGIQSNIMSLGGIAIAIGVVDDAAIVMVENIYRHLSTRRGEWKGDNRARLRIITEAAQEVGAPVFQAFLVIVVAFVPVFVLSGQAGKLFHPLAWTKSFVMLGAGTLAVTLMPVLCAVVMRGVMPPAEQNPLARLQNRLLFALYRPALRGTMLLGPVVIPLMAGGLLAGALFAWPRIKSEFMPPLNEGDLLYMPVLLPGASLTEAREILRVQDQLISSVPEVISVVGKAGRAETATDPAPVTMFETIIQLRPQEEWRPGVTRQHIIDEITNLTRMPGLGPIMTQPIQNRIDMLASGIQTPVGVKVFGDDLREIERIAIRIEEVARGIPGAVNPYAERIGSRPYLEIDIDRAAIARYGLRIDDVQTVIESALGGENITTTVEGRERYPVRVRYQRELRENLDAIRRILVPTPSGAQIPLEQLAAVRRTLGPAMIASENTRTYARVFVPVNTEVTGLVDFVEDLQAALDREIRPTLPAGYYYTISGQYEAELESRARLRVVVPVCLAVILFLLYMQFHSWAEALLLFSALPFGLAGGLLFQWWMGYNFSTAVWVGYIALFGTAVEDGIVMLETLKAKAARAAVLSAAIVEGSLERVRAIVMTNLTTIIALFPLFLEFHSTGGWLPGFHFNQEPGTEIMQPIAAPTIGGMFTSTMTTLLVVPVVFYWLESFRRWRHGPPPAQTG